MTTDNDIAIAAVNVAATTASALYAAVAKAQAHARGVEKDSTNTFHRYKYASAESLIAEAKERARRGGPRPHPAALVGREG
jgi:phosphoribulokinase